ncbi:olfactory receptor 10A7-like [Spea bombifrons]|uniref:olfactory receptor 10A7-like n=1 Tax=Spea bombifrons TaxID=233779 RepID=UPI002349414B|nr:olfactory receptor 10A7-like [Spea bombifrons]
MFLVNHTEVTEFMLLGFRSHHILTLVLFVLFLVIYILTLVENLMIIILVANVPSLKSPMYVFLTQLSTSDILLTTNIVPNTLHVIINEGSTISVTGCITQFYIHCVLTAAECFLLTVMSYDRYLAICRPLHYTSVMHLRLQLQLIILCWLSAFIVILPIVLLMNNLDFCGPHIIDHYFCDLAPVLELSCSDSTIVELVDFSLGIPFLLSPFFFILFTYIYIFITIIGISGTIGRQKAFSTCSSHLIVVCTYYGTLIMVYMFPSNGQTSNDSKIMSILYTMGTSFVNPIIYSLKNKEIMKNLLKYLTNIRKKN